MNAGELWACGCGINAFMHVIFELLDLLSKLTALVPKLRVILTQFHRVFSPNSKRRTLVTPARRVRTEERRISMTCTCGHKGTTIKAGIRSERHRVYVSCSL